MGKYMYFLIALVPVLGSCGNRAQETATGGGVEQIPDRLADLIQRSEKDPGNAMIYNELALYHLSKDNFSEALGNINKSLQLEPKNTAHFVTLSDIYLMMGDADRSQLTLYRAMDIEPNNAEIYVHIGRLQVFMKDYDKAFVNLKRALELDNNNSKAYFWRGVGRIETGDTAQAISDWQLAVAFDPGSFDGYFKLGMLMAERKDSFAADYLEHAFRLAPPDTYLLYDIAMAFQGIERFNRSVEIYIRILDIDSCFFKAYFNLGYLNLIEFDEYNIAIDYFSKALECKPDYADAMYNRGLTHEILGDLRSARDDYQSALRISVNHQKAIDALNRLDELQRGG